MAIVQEMEFFWMIANAFRNCATLHAHMNWMRDKHTYKEFYSVIPQDGLFLYNNNNTLYFLLT